jgi:23S rRNA-/tRNA-specific pseudouridylate synthase
VDYKQRVVYEDEGFLVVDKPGGCPCSPHASNQVDCLDIAVAATLGISRLTRYAMWNDS